MHDLLTMIKRRKQEIVNVVIKWMKVKGKRFLTEIIILIV